jgi:hypothetical protein
MQQFFLFFEWMNDPHEYEYENIRLHSIHDWLCDQSRLKLACLQKAAFNCMRRCMFIMPTNSLRRCMRPSESCSFGDYWSASREVQAQCCACFKGVHAIKQNAQCCVFVTTLRAKRTQPRKARTTRRYVGRCGYDRWRYVSDSSKHACDHAHWSCVDEVKCKRQERQERQCATRHKTKTCSQNT